MGFMKLTKGSDIIEVADDESKSYLYGQGKEIELPKEYQIVCATKEEALESRGRPYSDYISQNLMGKTKDFSEKFMANEVTEGRILSSVLIFENDKTIVKYHFVHDIDATLTLTTLK